MRIYTYLHTLQVCERHDEEATKHKRDKDAHLTAIAQQDEKLKLMATQLLQLETHTQKAREMEEKRGEEERVRARESAAQSEREEARASEREGAREREREGGRERERETERERNELAAANSKYHATILQNEACISDLQMRLTRYPPSPAAPPLHCFHLVRKKDAATC